MASAATVSSTTMSAAAKTVATATGMSTTAKAVASASERGVPTTAKAVAAEMGRALGVTSTEEAVAASIGARLAEAAVRKAGGVTAKGAVVCHGRRAVRGLRLTVGIAEATTERAGRGRTAVARSGAKGRS